MIVPELPVVGRVTPSPGTAAPVLDEDEPVDVSVESDVSIPAIPADPVEVEVVEPPVPLDEEGALGGFLVARAAARCSALACRASCLACCFSCLAVADLP